MYIFFAIAAIIILITSVILFSKLRLTVSYCKNEGEKPEFSVTVSLLGKIIIKKNNSNIKHTEKRIDLSNAEKESEEKDKKLIEKLKTLAESFSIVKNVYSKNRRSIKKCILAEKLDIYIKFGLFDAMQTGIATGIVWALLYNMLSLISAVGTVYEHGFEVEPVFDKAGFCSSGKGIFSFRLINIIIVSLKVYITYKKICRKRRKNG